MTNRNITKLLTRYIYVILIIALIDILALTTIFSYIEYQRGILREAKRWEASSDLLLTEPFVQYSYLSMIHTKKNVLDMDTEVYQEQGKKESVTVTDSAAVVNGTPVYAKITTRSNLNSQSSVSVSDDASTYTIKKKPKKKEKKIKPGDRVADLAEKLCTHDPLYNYVLGGRELSTEEGHGIDCAHFVGLVYRECGFDVREVVNDGNVRILRTSLSKYIAAEYSKDSPIKLDEMKRGDIIIFFNEGHDSHTAIYAGDGMIAHAANEEMGVTMTDMGYDEETGIAKYNGKTVQCIIRRAVGQEMKKKNKPDNKLNMISTDIRLYDSERREPFDIEEADIDLLVNEHNIVGLCHTNPYQTQGDINRIITIEVDGHPIEITVSKEDNHITITTKSGKKAELRIKPVISVTEKEITLSGIHKSPDA